MFKSNVNVYQISHLNSGLPTKKYFKEKMGGGGGNIGQ